MCTEPLYSNVYAIPYCILIAIIIGIYLSMTNNIITKRFAANLTAFIILIFIGLRGHIQSDFIMYYKFFESLPNIWEPKFYQYKNLQFEPGFVIYTAIVKGIWPNYFFWVFLNTSINVGILVWCFRRYSDSSVLSWILFLLFNGLIIEFNLYRNSIALVIFLLSIPYIQERRFVPFFLLWLLELTFHTSALIYLPTYFILNRVYSQKLLIAIFILSNIVFFFDISPTSYLIEKTSSLVSLFPQIGKASGYFEKNISEMGITLGYLERTFIFLMLIYLYPNLNKKNQSNLIFSNSFFIYYLLFYFFSDVKVFVERFPLLFTYSYWIIVPNMLYMAKGKKRSIWLSVFFIFSMIKITSVTRQLPYKYDNIVSGIEDYQTKKMKNVYFRHQMLRKK